jgi:L-fuculose-phosphate aldolase
MSADASLRAPDARDPDAADPRSEQVARRSVIDACLRMNALGINQGKAGNASLRWARSGADGYLITPSALPYEAMREAHVFWLALDADADAPAADVGATVFPESLPVAGTLWRQRRRDGGPELGDTCVPAQGERAGLAPSTEWRMHRELHRRLGARAVVHAHSPYATSLACLPRIQREGIPAFHYMVAVAGGTDIRCAGYATFGTQALADAAVAALQGRRACLLAHHGLLAHGDTLAQALAVALEVETLARMYWQALQIGEPALLDDAQMAEVLARFARYGPGQAGIGN